MQPTTLAVWAGIVMGTCFVGLPAGLLIMGAVTRRKLEDATREAYQRGREAERALHTNGRGPKPDDTVEVIDFASFAERQARPRA